MVKTCLINFYSNTDETQENGSLQNLVCAQKIDCYKSLLSLRLSNGQLSFDEFIFPSSALSKVVHSFNVHMRSKQIRQNSKKSSRNCWSFFTTRSRCWASRRVLLQFPSTWSTTPFSSWNKRSKITASFAYSTRRRCRKFFSLFTRFRPQSVPLRKRTSTAGSLIASFLPKTIPRTHTRSRIWHFYHFQLSGCFSGIERLVFWTPEQFRFFLLDQFFSNQCSVTSSSCLKLARAKMCSLRLSGGWLWPVARCLPRSRSNRSSATWSTSTQFASPR